MTLTLELPAEVEQVLEAQAQARGVTLPKYLQELAAREAQAIAPQQQRRVLRGRGKYAGRGVSVEGLLRERREEGRREMEGK